jgi:hypothetical protein
MIGGGLQGIAADLYHRTAAGGNLDAGARIPRSAEVEPPSRAAFKFHMSFTAIS